MSNPIFALPGDLPMELGVSIFSGTHLCWLTGAALLIGLTVWFFLRQTQAGRRRMLLTCAISLLGLEAARDLWLLLTGRFDPAYMLPLHLCGIMIFVEGWAVFYRNRFAMELSYCLGLTGAFFALVTPGETSLPFFNLYYYHFILSHLLLCLIPLLFLADGFRPRATRLPSCFLFLLGCAAIAFCANRFFGGNYLFLGTASPGSPLDLLANLFGHFYLFAAAGLVWLLWGIVYFPWIRRAYRQGRSNPSKR